VSKCGDRIENKILAALPRNEYERIQPLLEVEQWPSGKSLYTAGQKISHVYFINTGMASLVSLTDEGASIEVGVIGPEGMVGISAILGRDRMPHSAIVQLPGHALKMKLTALNDEFTKVGKLQSLLMRHMYLLHFQVARSVHCNRFHHVESRLCRWLLMSRDRIDSNEVPLTQEFVATMLGVARPIVSLTARTLQNAGLIEYKMGHITILDIEGLKAAACDCYEIVVAESKHFSNGENRSARFHL
jgi:CRP-like cAMP-binding protein